MKARTKSRSGTAPGSGERRAAEAPLPTAGAEQAAPGRTERFVRANPVRITAAQRMWLLRAVDLALVNLVLLAVLALRLPYKFGLSTLLDVPIYFLLLSLLWLLWAAFFECYDLPRSADPLQGAWAAARAALFTAGSYLAIPYLTPHFLASRLSSILFVGLLAAFMPAWRALYAALFSQVAFQERVLVVGAGKSGSELARGLAGTPHFGNPHAGQGVYIVGFVDDDPAKAGTKVEGIPVLGDRNALRDLVARHKIDVVVLAITHIPAVHPELLSALLDCREQGVHLEPMTRLYERLTGRVPVEHAGQNLEVILPPSEPAHREVFLLLKRLADIVVSCLGLLCVALVTPWVALANRVTSPGPLFYWQTRVGQRGRHFRLVKFRSMIPTAEENVGPVWAKENDRRVTPVGRALRTTHLDEWPQFWNVLRGEMSLIGPRPERPELAAGLASKLPFYQARHAVQPGITGWAQVRFGYGSSEQDALVKLQYDLFYIKHRGLFLDLAILMRTAAAMLRFQGR